MVVTGRRWLATVFLDVVVVVVVVAEHQIYVNAS